MQTNKKWYVTGAVALAIVVGVVGYSRRSNAPAEMSPSPSTAASPSRSPSAGTSKSGSAANSPKTYTDYVKEYNGRRIQFDINCQAIPNNVTFKTGSTLMFDNRSGEARTIKIGDASYQFPGYGYRILTLTSKTLSKTLLISCGDAVNVGQILLQK